MAAIALDNYNFIIKRIMPLSFQDYIVLLLNFILVASNFNSCYTHLIIDNYYTITIVIIDYSNLVIVNIVTTSMVS